MGVSDMSDENMPPMSLLWFSWLALLLSQYMQLLLSVMAPLPGCVIFMGTTMRDGALFPIP
jgi:hypothetical protein